MMKKKKKWDDGRFFTYTWEVHAENWLRHILSSALNHYDGEVWVDKKVRVTE
jgi:hypothetical protein